jgi:hypothetical protein
MVVIMDKNEENITVTTMITKHISKHMATFGVQFNDKLMLEMNICTVLENRQTV